MNNISTMAGLFHQSLMSVMAGLQKIGIFRWIAQMLLGRVKSGRRLVLTLVLLCFFSSMLITNDVALITFVPFTFTVLDLLGEEQKKRLLLPVVVMQTIAANLGSMLTPVGNPQNLYLYGKAGFSVGAFLVLMLPYTALSLVLLTGWGLVQGSICSQDLKLEASYVQEESRYRQNGKTVVCLFVTYLILFLLCLLTLGHILPWQAVFLVVFLVILMAEKRVLVKVDYSLLFTVGNICFLAMLILQDLEKTAIKILMGS